ncbi:hypothetical protein QL285_059090 [Trifolium repens]|nr:hypothetical protein QL285_059090 [Trifolium repens]
MFPVSPLKVASIKFPTSITSSFTIRSLPCKATQFFQSLLTKEDIFTPSEEAWDTTPLVLLLPPLVLCLRLFFSKMRITSLQS